jgi:hypothetical protein
MSTTKETHRVVRSSHSRRSPRPSAPDCVYARERLNEGGATMGIGLLPWFGRIHPTLRFVPSSLTAYRDA